MTAAGTPEHDLLHSGSRWEPAGTGALPPPVGTGEPAAPRRTSRGRRALVAVAGVACLLLGGLGGYLLGHGAGAPGSGSPTPAGFSGSTGGGPGDGGPGDGGFRHHDLPGAGPQDGTGTTGGLGTGSTGGNG